MTKLLEIVPRHHIDPDAWNACVATSSQQILYAYSWYLDAVLPAPDWKWVGVVMPDKEGGYRAVMPVPLRRKHISGLTYVWRVHQPFFCQILGVFTSDLTIDSSIFYQLIYRQFRYGSVLRFPYPGLIAEFDSCRLCTTQVLHLSMGYAPIYQYYTPECRRNLRRALAANWTVIDSVDLVPLIRLFRDNHAGRIEGG
ncbi:hypothetical protein [Spirosoma telluris]|uniref:hypothetical protein n=1 Tax=Spirosoma telluris TaxID=2183553 RepID=UPI002FC35A1B